MPNARPILPPLQTPKSASFPSELHDDSPATSSASSIIKQEDSSATTITPLTPHSSIPLPKAYTEFLEAMTPVFSPASAGPNFRKFHFEKKSGSPTSQPGSALSGSFLFSPAYARSPTVSLPPPTPGSAVSSKKGFPLPRRILLPQSMKYSPTSDSPRSATSIRSPYSSTDSRVRYLDPPRSSGGKPVSVKQVVTRTVTYKRTQLEAPPKGKRRKCRDSKDSKEISEFQDVKEFKFKEFKPKKETAEV